MSSCDQKRSENQRKVEIKDDNLEINTDRVINKWKRWIEMIAQSIERVWAVILSWGLLVVGLSADAREELGANCVRVRIELRA